MRNGTIAAQNQENIGYPVTRIETISEEKIDPNKVGFISDLSENDINEYKLAKDDILFSHINSLEHIGKTAIYEGTPEGLIHGMNLLLLRPNKKEVFPKYLLYLLKIYKMRSIFRAMAKKAVNQASINQTELGRLEIFKPPLPEQKKIAEVLSCVDSAIQRVDEAIAKTERLKKGLMQKLLTEGIGHKEFKETKIGKTPKTWTVTKLGDILELCQYGLSVAMSEEGKYPIIRMDEISEGYVSPNIKKYVDLDTKTFKSFKLEKGDVLFNRTNSYELVGRTGIFLLNGDYVFASYLIRLRPKKDILDPLFLTFYLIFSHNRLKHLATRAVHQANINATNLKNFVIVLPTLEEQQKIVTLLSSFNEKLELDRTRKQKLERIKKGLMNDMLTGRKRVKVAS